MTLRHLPGCLAAFLLAAAVLAPGPGAVFAQDASQPPAAETPSGGDTAAQRDQGAGQGSVAPAHSASDDEPPEGQTKHYAMSLIKTPKYEKGFDHFDYVNPDAPKGGSVRLSAIGTFDSLNPFLFKGNAAAGLGLTYDSLFDDSLEEPSTSYGLLAEWASWPDDFSSVTFRLRDNARWQDGKPVTPEDVIFSLNFIKKANPRYALYYKNAERVEKTGPHEVTFYFDKTGNRELPVIMAQLTVLPKHYWEGKSDGGKQRDMMKTTLEPPLGSGPYEISDVSAGRSITYTRVKDYWAKDLPVMRGKYNFDQIRYEYFRDQTVAFEAFKAGRIDYYDENSSKNWATAYDFPAIQNGWVKKQKVKLDTGQPMQAFIFNLRRDKFQDPKVRTAFNLAFDFDWANKNLFYGQYKRTKSYFQNTELAATGLPKGHEKEILEQFRGKIPDEVFTKPYANPGSGDASMRDSLRKAQHLLREAGWKVVNEVKPQGPDCGWWCSLLLSTGLRSPNTKPVLRKDGKAFNVEFLLVSPLFERIVQPYITNLDRLGIQASIRLVDSSQYQQRMDTFDFDIATATFAQSRSPGNEQRDFWGSDAAGRQGSQNLIGIRDEAIDGLIDKIIFSTDRDDLVAATRALDRVLLWHHYLVPQWYSPDERIAYWDKFGEPRHLPDLGVGFLNVWWYDHAAAEKLAQAR